MTLRGDCYTGCKGVETPRRFYLGERAVEIVEVLDRGLAPAHASFKVRDDDGGIYILRHDVGSGRWELTMFEPQPKADP